MNRKLYFTLTTIAFGIISIPTVLSIVFQERILIDYIDRAFIKIILIFFISVIEVSYIKKTIPKVIGWISLFVLIIGFQFRIMHWPWLNEMIIGAGLVLIINLLTMALIERNKGLIHYFLFLFIFQRLLIILAPPNEFLWWIDVIICFVLTLVGIGYLLNIKVKKVKIKAGNN